MIDRMILALGMITLSQGIPFYHLGMEFGRSKKLHHNSYNLSDEYNGINWNNTIIYKEVIDALKSLISLRNKYSIFRFKSKEEVNSYIKIDKFDGSLVLRYYDIINKY